jgi:hypothetical protein
VTPYGSCKNRRLGGTYRLHHQGKRIYRARSVFRYVLQILVTANAVPVLLIIFTLMMEVIRSSETSVLIRATRRNSQEDGILHSHRCENLNSDTVIYPAYQVDGITTPFDKLVPVGHCRPYGSGEARHGCSISEALGPKFRVSFRKHWPAAQTELVGRPHLSDIEQTKQEFSLQMDCQIALTRNSRAYKIYRVATKPFANISLRTGQRAANYPHWVICFHTDQFLSAIPLVIFPKKCTVVKLISL